MKNYLIIICMLLQIVAAKAEPVEIDGLKYDLNIDEKTASVSRYNTYDGILVIPETVTYDEIEYTVTEIADYAFNFQPNILSVTIPKSLKKIGDRAFEECSRLTSVKFGDGLEEIGFCSFVRCKNLQSLFFGNNIKKIASSAFYLCNGLNQIYISDLKKWCMIDFSSEDSNPLYYSHHLYLDKKEIVQLIIPKDIETIKQYSFIGGTYITSLVIGNSVSKIENSAFNNCTMLNSISFSESLTYIGSRSFQNCSNIEELDLPDNIKEIGQSAFSGCSKLERLKLPNTLEIINQDAFKDCSQLKTITFPATVEFIYQNAFSYPSSENVTIYLLQEYPPLAYDNSFPTNSEIYVPNGSIELYQNVSPWSSLNIQTNLLTGPEKCAKPEIIYKNGDIIFTCQTPDVEFHYKVTSEDFTMIQKGNETPISGIYKVSVYTSKIGYGNSDTVTSEINIKGIKGDVNDDGKVNVSDHVELSNIIMTQQENDTDN